MAESLEYNKYDDPRMRRKVRADYSSLTSTLHENEHDKQRLGAASLQEYLEKVETLFSKVRHPREAVYDSTILTSLTKKGREQAQQLKTDLVCFDNQTFLEKLISYGHGRPINSCNDEEIILSDDFWTNLKEKVCPVFKTIPQFSFLLGPLVVDVQIKEKIARGRKPRMDDNELLRLKEINSVEQQEEVTTKEVEHIFKILKTATEGGKTPICFFTFVINPTSFSQSVENIFHFSFLVKDGRVSLDLDDHGCPCVNLHRRYNEGEHGDGACRNQVVMPFSVQSWKEIIEVYKIREAMIPTRHASV